jgi:branched-chain amino acid transport system substrate-binding protein
MKSFGKFPEGLYMGTRANPLTPDTKTNQDWFNGYVKKYGYEPTGWDQQAYTCMLFLQKAIEKAGSTDNEAVIKALEGLEVVGPWGTPPSQKMRMRARDHSLILYTEAWGKTTSKMPYVADVLTLPWDEIEKTESEWLKKKGWL